MLFKNFDQIKNPGAVTDALYARAEARYGADEDAIDREAAKLNPRVWATEACQAMGVTGVSSDDLERAKGYAVVRLCEIASAIAGIRIAQLGTTNFRGVERGINNAALRLAS